MPDAVVLAGGVDRGEIARETGVAHRPLLDVGGLPIIRRVLGALRGAVSVGQVLLVAPEPVQQAVSDEAVDRRVPAGESFVENLVSGVEAAGPASEAVLVITGDLPLLTPAAVDDLARQAAATRADAVYSIVARQAFERAFPGGKRTYVRLREGTFTGGNGMVLARDFVRSHQELIRRLHAARKNPFKLAGMFGVGFVFGMVTGRLDLAQLETRASSIVGGRVAAVISPYPEIGFDVDKLADLNLARRML